MCKNEIAVKNKLIALMFKHTTTLGIRENSFHRHTMQRKESVVQTKYGKVRIKVSNGFGVIRKKAEYDDVAKIATDNDKSIQEILGELE
jgi:uncharacterized protein (DUF111 family)